MIKTNIKMRVTTPEQSRKVQEICLENGIDWASRKDIVQFIDKGFDCDIWPAHTDNSLWEQVENPDNNLDELKDLDETKQKAQSEFVTTEEFEQILPQKTSTKNDECEADHSINNGGKTDYYQLKDAPFPINDFDDFAEWRGMNGNQFNMGKVMWTFNTGRHSGTNYERDLYKIIHYANRELLRLKRENKK